MATRETISFPGEFEAQQAQAEFVVADDGSVSFFDQNIGDIKLFLPSKLDLKEARKQFDLCGGQVRHFGNGESVDIETLSFPEWLVVVKRAGYQPINEAQPDLS